VGRYINKILFFRYMKKIGGKRGASHVEMILAFIVFVGFFIFAMLFLNPLDNKRVMHSSLGYTFNEVADEVLVDMDVYSVKLVEDIDDAGEIIPFDSVLEIPINDLPLATIADPDSGYDPSIVQVKAANPVESLLLVSSYDSGTRLVSVERGNVQLVKLRFSEHFTEHVEGAALVPTTTLSEGQYFISSHDQRKVVSEDKVMELADRYDAVNGDGTGYQTLKQEFNLPSRVDFSFELRYLDPKTAEEIVVGPEYPREAPANLEVIVKVDKIETITNTEDEAVIFGNLIVKIW
jgi:hypothetical protein